MESDDGEMSVNSLVDRFSHIPEEIISHIFSFLPTKTVVATTFMSKRWKLRGPKMINVLTFDSRMWPKKAVDETALRFVEFVNMVLVNHSAESIHRFTLVCYLNKFRSYFLDIWINNVIARNVRNLDLNLDVRTEIALPSALFSSRTLEVLILRERILVPLPLVVSLPKLTVLKLYSVEYESDEAFHKLIFGCPMIHSLFIEREHYDDLKVHVISSPTLKHLEISFFHYSCDCAKGDDLKVKIDTPKLETLILTSDVKVGFSIIRPTSSVNKDQLDFETYQDSIVEFLQKFDLLRCLYLWTRTMILLESAPNQLSKCFERLTNLTVDFCTKATQWGCLLDLINCCTKLEVLELTKVSSYNESWTGPIKIPRCFSSSLKRVSFKDFSGLADEMRMLSHILQHGLLIETVSLRLGFDDPILRNKKRQIQNKVLQLHKASLACEISFSSL